MRVLAKTNFVPVTRPPITLSDAVRCVALSTGRPAYGARRYRLSRTIPGTSARTVSLFFARGGGKIRGVNGGAARTWEISKSQFAPAGKSSGVSATDVRAGV